MQQRLGEAGLEFLGDAPLALPPVTLEEAIFTSRMDPTIAERIYELLDEKPTVVVVDGLAAEDAQVLGGIRIGRGLQPNRFRMGTAAALARRDIRLISGSINRSTSAVSPFSSEPPDTSGT